MSQEREALRRGVDEYQNTVARLEPDIAMIDPGAFYASAAISLKRIADAMERPAEVNAIAPASEGLAPIQSIQREVITVGELREMLNRSALADDTPALVLASHKGAEKITRARFGSVVGADGKVYDSALIINF